MRLMVGRHAGSTSVFALDGDSAVNLSAQDPRFGRDLMPFISMGADGFARAAHRGDAAPVPVADIVPALPIAAPSKVICLGLNYADHAKEGGYDVPDYPALFMRATSSLIAADAPMVRPACSERLDYEVELMVIIGTGGRHIAEADALNHVFGYTLFNDGSVRDYQRKTHQWTPGKNFDGTGAVGPVVVTADDLPPGATGLKIESRLNGDVMQSANTDDMLFTVANTIATISEFATLQPGDMIAMGTPPGVGHARTPPVFMKHGDIIEIEIDGIGVCRNPVVDETADPMTVAAE